MKINANWSVHTLLCVTLKQLKFLVYVHQYFPFISSLWSLETSDTCDSFYRLTQVGVDFTASNGDPSRPKSRHFISDEYPNAYVRAIQSVGTVIQDYDRYEFSLYKLRVGLVITCTESYYYTCTDGGKTTNILIYQS